MASHRTPRLELRRLEHECTGPLRPGGHQDMQLAKERLVKVAIASGPHGAAEGTTAGGGGDDDTQELKKS